MFFFFFLRLVRSSTYGRVYTNTVLISDRGVHSVSLYSSPDIYVTPHSSISAMQTTITHLGCVIESTEIAREHAAVQSEATKQQNNAYEIRPRVYLSSLHMKPATPPTACLVGGNLKQEMGVGDRDIQTLGIFCLFRRS